MSLSQGVLLGLVQGLAEFLPVSSDGHLVLCRALFGIGDVPVLFDVLLHAPTLLVVLVYFRAEIARLVAERDAAYLGRIVLAGAATFAVAMPLQATMEVAFESTRAAGIGLLVTAVGLVSTAGRAGGRRRPSPLDALLIGLAQGLAPFPGVSRSGVTIAVAILRGVDRAEAFRFSFLLSIPTVAGALVLKVLEGGPVGAPPAAVAAAVAAAAVSGAAALSLVARVVVRPDRFHRFAWYVGPLGLLALLIGYD